MMLSKKKYYLIIENTKDINLNKIKKNNKFNIIYRNLKKKELLFDLLKFRNLCKLKRIGLFIANDYKLAILLKSDGVYISAYNKSFYSLTLKKLNFEIIGSAHNNYDINHKIKQGCSRIIISKLFKVNYDPHSKFLGVCKFNNLLKLNKNLIPLGGIKMNNLNMLKIIKAKSFVIMSELKKKPAIIRRLF